MDVQAPAVRAGVRGDRDVGHSDRRMIDRAPSALARCVVLEHIAVGKRHRRVDRVEPTAAPPRQIVVHRDEGEGRRVRVADPDAAGVLGRRVGREAHVVQRGRTILHGDPRAVVAGGVTGNDQVDERG